MISVKGIDYLKAMAELMADFIPGGVLFLQIDGDTIVWRRASRGFSLDLFQVGDKLNQDSVAKRAMKERKTLIQNVPRQLYGIRLKTIAEPLVNEEGIPVGVFSFVFPRLHPVARAFQDFAPVIANVFPEGGFLYLTDLQKAFERQSSHKFDIPSFQTGLSFTEHDAPHKAIKSKKPVLEERDSSRFGVPVLESCCPLFDEDNPEEVVATLGVLTPKTAAHRLRTMSEDMENGVAGIASAIEELAATASSIHVNEKDLEQEIQSIVQISDEIEKISSFIKEIANQTKMLGLNATIEAARAGDAGKGFGVVADQIRKLSEESKNTVPKIKQMTDQIKKTVEETSRKSLVSLRSSEEQAAATEEMTTSIQQIIAMANDLNRIARDL